VRIRTFSVAGAALLAGTVTGTLLLAPGATPARASADQTVAMNLTDPPSQIATYTNADGSTELYAAAGGSPYVAYTKVGSGNVSDLQLPAYKVAVDGSDDVFTYVEGSGVVNELGPATSGKLVQFGIDVDSSNPVDLAVDAAGDVFVTSDASVIEFPAGGNQQQVTVPFTCATSPLAIAVDTAGDVFGQCTSGQLAEVPRQGSGYGSQVDLPSIAAGAGGLAVDSAGNVFATYDAGTVLTVPRMSATTWGSAVTVPFSGVQNPVAIAVDSHDDIFVADYNLKQVIELAGWSPDVAPAFQGNSPLLTATAGAPYSYTFAATGVPAPTYALARGAPSWLTINAATGAVTGTVPRHGTSTFTYSVNATNEVGTVTAGPYQVRVYPPGFLPKAVLSSTLSCPATVTTAKPVTCTLTVANAGPDAAPSAVADIEFPHELTATGCTAGCTHYSTLAAWHVGTLAAGASDTVTVTLAVREHGSVWTLWGGGRSGGYGSRDRISAWVQARAINPDPSRGHAAVTITITR
jgi:uncharacterized protein DUF11/putative Ig domain-containing protein